MRHSHRDGALLRIADLAALALALPGAHRLHRALVGAEPPSLQEHWGALVAVLALWTVSAWAHGVYHERPRLGSQAVVRAASALSLAALVLAAAVFLLDLIRDHQLLFVLYFALGYLGLATVRVGLQATLHAFRRRGYHARRYAVVGTGGHAREIVETHEAHPEWGMRFAGFVVVDGEGAETRGPVLGRLSRLGHVLEDEVLDTVFFAVGRDQLDLVEPAVILCQEHGIDVQVSLDLLRFGPTRMQVREVDGLPMLAFCRTPTDDVALLGKRAFDVVASAIVLVVLALPLALVALAIKLDSPGPVFFRQRRSGLNGRVFDMLKFRSMYVDAEARLEALKAHNEMSGPVFKMANDPRVTRVGRFLRKTSLDEFPQFWNVLKGEMSVVGPRPPIPAEVRRYKRWQRRRLSMKPGITCIWQISGRNNVDFDHWMELDLEYIDHWSLWSDLEICVKTIPAVLSARGAR